MDRGYCDTCRKNHGSQNHIVFERKDYEIIAHWLQKVKEKDEMLEKFRKIGDEVLENYQKIALEVEQVKTAAAEAFTEGAEVTSEIFKMTQKKERKKRVKKAEEVMKTLREKSNFLEDCDRKLKEMWKNLIGSSKDLTEPNSAGQKTHF